MNLKGIIESMLLAAAKPLTVGEIEEVIKIGMAAEGITEGGPSIEDIKEALKSIGDELSGESRGFCLAEIAGGYQLRTKPENSKWIQILNQPKAMRLTIPSMETLAIVAYRQPITRAEIEALRGVDTGGVLKTLLERRLVRILGKKDEPGRPLLYGTTNEFLEVFGLKDLSDLPPLKEFQEKVRQEMITTDKGPLRDWDLSALELTSPEKLAELGEEERMAIEELDKELKGLRKVEKEIFKEEETAEPDPVSGLTSESGKNFN